jgi:3-phosphoshikimate 1-carboxyvinyltransferase
MTVRVVRPGVASGRAAAPPSKSYTHRAVLLGHYSGRRFTIIDPLDSDDTWATLRGVAEIGTAVRRQKDTWVLSPGAEHSSGRTRTIRCHESGTTLRFLLPAAARLPVRVRFEAGRRLRRRPVLPLLSVLRAAGVRTTPFARGPGLVQVRGPMEPVQGRLDGSASSQFLSGLLLALPTLSGPSAIRVTGSPVSRPYVDATLEVLRRHGITIHENGRRINVGAPQTYIGTSFRVPGDASSAAYLWAAGAVTGGTVAIERVADPTWPQADLAILPLLGQMGATVNLRRRSTCVAGPLVRPIDADLTAAPDLLPLLGVLAATVPGVSRIRGASHARGKESNRRTETARLARAMGATVSLTAGMLKIEGRARPQSFSYGGAADHRMVMSAGVGALTADAPCRIGSAETVGKSFPGFWTALAGLTGRQEPDP